MRGGASQNLPAEVSCRSRSWGDDFFVSILRGDGISSGDYPSTEIRTGVEQLTYSLFLKMADGQSKGA